MARNILLPLGFLLGVVAGCSGHTVGPIDFQVTGGFTGQGDGTPPMRIDPDGTVTRTGPAGSTQTTKLDRSTIDDLEAKIDAAGFPTLAPRYTAGADCYVYEVSVQLDGNPYTVAADTMAQLPPALDALIATLKDISKRPLDVR